MMFKFIAFAVLVSMILMLSEARWPTTTEPDAVIALNNQLAITFDSSRPDHSEDSENLYDSDESDEPNESDESDDSDDSDDLDDSDDSYESAVSDQLNDPDDWEDLDDFDKYQKALQQMIVPDNKPKAKKLRELILELLPGGNPDFCAKKNLETLSAVSEIVFARVKNMPANLGLLNMLKDYTDEAWNTCLDLLEKEFGETAQELSKKDTGLKLMSGLFNDLGRERKSKKYDSLTSLLGAIKNKRSKRKLNSFFRITVRAKLDRMFCEAKGPNVHDIPCALKIDELTGEDADLTFDEAQGALNKYIFNPCSSFVAIEGVANVLGRVVDLGMAVLNKDSSLEFEDEYETLKWAPIKLICEWFNEQDKDNIAKRTMKPSLTRLWLMGHDKEADYMLNSWLVAHERSNWNIYDNINKIKRLRLGESPSDTIRKSAATMNLVRLISKLASSKQEDFCSLANLENLRALIETLLKIQKDSFRVVLTRRRLNYVLYVYTRTVQVRCLDKVESAFATTETLNELSQYEILKKLDRVCLIDVDKQVDYQLKPLIGTLGLPKEVRTSWIFRTPSFEGKLMSALNDKRQEIEDETNEIGLVQETRTAASLTDEQTQAIADKTIEVGSDKETMTAETLTDEQTQATEDTTNEVATGQETSKPKSMTVEEAKAYLNDNFFHKCQSFIKNESVKKILDLVIAIGRATRHVPIGFSKRDPKTNASVWGKDYKTLQWVPRFLLCKWFHAVGVETFATLLSKKLNEL